LSALNFPAIQIPSANLNIVPDQNRIHDIRKGLARAKGQKKTPEPVLPDTAKDNILVEETKIKDISATQKVEISENSWVMLSTPSKSNSGELPGDAAMA
jgi:hypothetical protein